MLLYRVSDPETDSQQPNLNSDSLIEARSYFVRHRNALLVRANFEPIYVDHYLHLMDHGIKYDSAADQMLKDTYATIVLHATTRPWHERHAWTLNFQRPRMNLFATASSLEENVVGRLFTENVREMEKGLFHAQVTMDGKEARLSSVELESKDIFEAVESFYLQSEQRRARIFRYTEEELVMVSAQPECDDEWLESLTDTAIRELDQSEELSLLETRRFRFSCGCNLERIYPAIAPLASQGLDKLFQGDEAITVTCPRCAKKWRLTREMLEALM